MKSVSVEGQNETFETIKPLDAAKAAYRAALKDRQDCQAALRNVEARQRQLDDAIQDARLKLAARPINAMHDIEQVKAAGRQMAAMQGEISALEEAAVALNKEHSRLESELRGYDFEVSNSKTGIWETIFDDKLASIRETLREIYSAGQMSGKNRLDVQECIIPIDLEDCIPDLVKKYGLPN